MKHKFSDRRAAALIAALFALLFFTVQAFAEGGNGDGSGGGKDQPLTLVSSSVANGAQNVSLTPEIVLTFSKNVVHFTVRDGNMACFSMTDAQGNDVPIHVEMGDDQVDPSIKRIVTVSPQSALTPGTSYLLKISRGVTSKSGVSLGRDSYISFTTKGAETTKPVTTKATTTKPTTRATTTRADTAPTSVHTTAGSTATAATTKKTAKTTTARTKPTTRPTTTARASTTLKAITLSAAATARDAVTTTTLTVSSTLTPVSTVTAAPQTANEQTSSTEATSDPAVAAQSVPEEQAASSDAAFTPTTRKEASSPLRKALPFLIAGIVVMTAGAGIAITIKKRFK